MSRATTGLYISPTLSTLTLIGNTASDLVVAGTATFGSITNTGNLTGNVAGDLFGDVTGNVTGDLTGDVTGNISGVVHNASAFYTVAGTKVVGTQESAIGNVSAGIGTANAFLVAVSGSGDDTTINNNFEDLADKINNIIGVLSNHGLTSG